MVRQTSVEAYNEIKDNGLLSQRRWEVYEVLFFHGPMTANEVFNYLTRTRSSNVFRAHSTNSRFSELREMGVIKETKERICKVTGRNVIEWDVTENIPKKYRKDKLVKDTRFICLMCGKSWPEKLEDKLQGRPQVHYDTEGQYCFGELEKYQRC